MNKEIILELKNISFWFDWSENYLLKDINFSLNKWEIISLIWLNWAWKTTLLKIIAWIYKPNKWKIIRKYHNLAYVPQKLNIDKNFPITVYDFINIFNDKLDKKYLKKLFEMFCTKNLYNKKIWNLSWWELQKILIISALVSKPDLILLDEPTAWIDIVWEENFYAIISQVKEIFPNISIILVSHNLNLVYKNSDYIVCLHKGNYCCHGTPSEEEFNKKVQNIFWKNLSFYEHNPHDKDKHLD